MARILFSIMARNLDAHSTRRGPNVTGTGQAMSVAPKGGLRDRTPLNNTLSQPECPKSFLRTKEDLSALRCRRKRKQFTCGIANRDQLREQPGRRTR
jgi:hypothetical protein